MSVALKVREVYGTAEPRIAPPLPARTLVKEYIATAKRIGIKLYPWQKIAAQYITAIGPDGRWMFPEVAIVVGRQNGKTELLKPLILMRLEAGRRIMHSAQNRELPREVYGQIADLFLDDPTLLASRNGRVLKPRFSNGQEEIRLDNKGLYRIVAPTRGGARGPSNDDVLVDELREMTDNEFLAAAEPTLFASANPQILYLSNAGEDDSVPLNALRQRAEEDPTLAYLEWSAPEDMSADDREGWRQANPSVGHNPTAWSYLERKFNAYRLSNDLETFETEHLCRWVHSMVAPLVRPEVWEAYEAELGAPRRPVAGFALDPEGRRASACLAWQQQDGTYAVQPMLERSHAVALDVDTVGAELRQLVTRNRVRDTGYARATDLPLARFLRRARAIDGREYATASANFATLTDGGQLRWADPSGLLAEDLKFVIRRPAADGTAVATRIDGAPPVTAALAAIRAVWLASAPRRVPRIG